MYDVKKDFLYSSMEHIKENIKKQLRKKESDEPILQKKLEEIVSRISLATNAEIPAKNADLIIEAIVENLDIKKELFSQLDRNVPENAILTSNTSSLSISQLANVSGRKHKFAGLHFFNPVPSMKLVEIIKIDETSQETLAALQSFAASLGKTAIVCKDTPGFVVNRLLIPYLMEAVKLAEQNIASPSDIDTAMKLGAGYPMGPFELLDYVGLDTVKFILDAWREEGSKEVDLVLSPMLKDLVAKGHFGKKSGQGFYSYPKI